MAEDIIIVIDYIEEAEDNKGKTYLKITDRAGATRNFKEGRNKLLTNKGHLLQEGRAIKLHFAEFTNPEGIVFPYVQDFEAIEGTLPKPTKPVSPPLQEGEEPIVQEAIKMGAKITSVDNLKNRSMSVSYAKDCWIAGKIERKELGEMANWFLKYIENK